MDCIFCKIVKGEISARKIAETESTLTFLDAFPLTKGHSLVISKKHYEKIYEMKEKDYTDFFAAVKQIVTKIQKIANASLIAIHDGKESGQEIPHVHAHIIPRKPDDIAGPVHALFKHKPNLTDTEFDEILSTLK